MLQKPKLKIQMKKYEIATLMFKRGCFDFITCKDGKDHEKQKEALRILSDKKTREFLYGGAAGGAKSWTGAAWLVFSCLAFPETKWFVGRESLKRIRESTYITIQKVLKEYGVPKSQWKYHGTDNYIVFKNGSRIDFLDLRYLPSDPLYERYGSVEYTGGWIEEGGEVNFGAFDTLKSRIGRHMNDKYGIKPKIYVTCNPKKNWMYTYFYKPWKAGTLKEYQKYITAFVFDNPFLDADYIEVLMSTTDKVKRERLLNGNWEYDDNPYKLCIYEKILDAFTNEIRQVNPERFITCDVARFGSDKAVICVWNGWEMIHRVTFALSATTDIVACIKALRAQYSVPLSNCIVDSDGVGGGVVDSLKAIGFVNNGQPFKVYIGDRKDKPKFRNVKSQLLVYLAEEIINKNKIKISAEMGENDKQEIMEELDTIEVDPDIDNIVALKSKDDVKKDIGRSPDNLDAIMLRCYFDFKKANPNQNKNLSAMFH